MEQKTLLKNKKNQGNGGETMAKRDDSVKKKVPELRFKGFTDDWEERKLSDIADRFNNLRVPITASERKSGDTPYYGANGIQDYVEGFTHDGEFILVAEDGANDLKIIPYNTLMARFGLIIMHMCFRVKIQLQIISS